MGNLTVIQYALYQGLVFSIIGVIYGVLYSFGGFFIDTLVDLGWLSAEQFETTGLSLGTFYAFGAIFGMPWIFAIVGVASGVVVGILLKIIMGLINIFR